MIEIYKASAGSGKTYTLTREYIKFILGYKDENGQYVLHTSNTPHHSSVLAITFTNKATEEMKTRIIHELAVLAGMERGWTTKSPYLEEFLETFNCTEKDLQIASKRALRNLLFNFNTFSVSTIDAFFQTILRSFAREAEVSSSYEVQIDDNMVNELAVNEMLQDINHNGNSRSNQSLLTWLTKFMTHQIEEGHSFNIFNRQLDVHSKFIGFIGNLCDETFRANQQEISKYFSDEDKFKRFRDEVFNRGSVIKRTLIAKCQAALDAIRHSGVTNISKHILTPLNNWTSGNFKNPPSATVIKASNDISSIYTKKNKANSPCCSPAEEEVILEAILYAIDAFSEMDTLKTISSNLYHLGLFSSVLKYVDQYRLANHTILLSDTNELLASIIGDQDSPFLYEKVGNRFTNYLIDEFQDTSYSQWKNIQPLLAESLGVGGDNLIIGDEKQSIYRFRGSDPSLLRDLHTLPFLQPKGVGHKVKGDKLSENTNYRSSSDVVRFNNTLFTAISKTQPTYSSVAQKIYNSHGGYVKMQLIDKSDNDSTESQEKALKLLADELARQIRNGYNPCDIAVLVRTWDEGHSVISYLEKLQLSDETYPRFNFVSDSSLKISQSAVIMRIINRMKVMVANDFGSSKGKRTNREVAELFHFYEREISTGCQPSEALADALKATEKIDHSVSPRLLVTPDEQTQALDVTYNISHDLVSLVESIIKAENIPDDDLKDQNVFITAFRDAVVDFMQRGQGDIRAFLRWWDEKGYKESVVGGKDTNAITVLTIHKSKGLEYPCVHIPFASFNLAPKSSEIAWFEYMPLPGINTSIAPPMLPLELKSGLENTPYADQYRKIVADNALNQLNLEYVAFTRAGEELIISCIVPKSDSKEQTTGKLISDALEYCTESIVEANFQKIKIIAEEEKKVKEELRKQRKSIDKDDEDKKELVNPFVAIIPNEDNLIEIGAPTFKRKKEKKDSQAMSPSKTITMPVKKNPEKKDSEGKKPEKKDSEGKNSEEKKENLWERTRLDSKKINSVHIPRERGIIIHNILANVIKREDIDKAFSLFRRSPDYKNITPEEFEELKALVKERVSNPEVRDWFNDCQRVLTEREIITSSGEKRRFDRVVWTKDGRVLLIDYKTGYQPSKKYRKQIRNYIAELSKAGFPNVSGYLYYLDTGKVMEI